MILYVRRKGMSTEVLKEILAYIDEHIYEKNQFVGNGRNGWL